MVWLCKIILTVSLTGPIWGCLVRFAAARQRPPTKANRRSNAETGNRAFKAFLGDQIYSTHPVAQRNDILCMAIAYNITRLVVLGVDQGVDVSFVGGAQALAEAQWVDLDTLYRSMTTLRSKTRRLSDSQEAAG